MVKSKMNLFAKLIRKSKERLFKLPKKVIKIFSVVFENVKSAISININKIIINWKTLI